MRNKKVLEMTTIAMFATIIFVMAWFPMVGFIPLFGMSVTIIHIPVIIGAMYGGRKMGFYLGIFFGLASWMMALIRASQPFDLMFQNPLLAVVPRAIFGFIIWYVYAAFKHLIKNKPASIAATFLTVSLIHTLLVMGTAIAMTPFYEEVLGAAIFEFLIFTILPFVAPLEMGVAALIGTPIVLRLMRSDFFSETRAQDERDLNINEN